MKEEAKERKEGEEGKQEAKERKEGRKGRRRGADGLRWCMQWWRCCVKQSCRAEQRVFGGDRNFTCVYIRASF